MTNQETTKDVGVRVALVTGGRRGIGRGIAYSLAASGFDIAIADLAFDDDANETIPLNPLTDVTVIVEDPLLPGLIVRDDGLAEMVKSGTGGCRYGMRLFVNGLPTPVTKS